MFLRLLGTSHWAKPLWGQLIPLLQPPGGGHCFQSHCTDKETKAQSGWELLQDGTAGSNPGRSSCHTSRGPEVRVVIAYLGLPRAILGPLPVIDSLVPNPRVFPGL